ncbi:MAG: T9SS type A sorting domain-containing protein [Chitinophagales bacterium]
MKNLSQQFPIWSLKLLMVAGMLTFQSIAYSQITISFTVDMTGKPISPGGVHIAGDFLAHGSTTITEDWNPAAEGSQLTLLFGNIYGIEVIFPETSSGESFQFQFLRDSTWFNMYGDMSEGNAGSHLTLDCGIDDGFFGLNRIITIPYCNANYDAVWNYCAYLEYNDEICNGLDDDCNGIADDGIIETISIAAGGPTTFCQGGNVNLIATYTGTSVQWKKNGINIPGATASNYSATKQGTYTCNTTSPCGSAISTGISVTVNKNPLASITAGGATTFCAGGSVVLTANAGGGLSYQWYKGASAIAGATNINYTAVSTGNYKCRVTKTATGCFTNSNAISVSVPCKEGKSESKNKLSIFPNPAVDQFILSAQFATSGNATIEIYNNLGALVYFKEVVQNFGMIEEAVEFNQPAGVYFVKVKNQTESVESKIAIY